MHLKFFCIMIFVTLHVDYISSNDNFQVRICQSDQAVLLYLTHFNTGVLPILIINSIENNSLYNQVNMDMIKEFYKNNNVENLLVVPVDTCVETYKLLHRGTGCSQHIYPSLVGLKDCRLYPKRWNIINQFSLAESFIELKNCSPPPNSGITFDFLLGKSLEVVKQRKERDAAERLEASVRSIMPAMYSVHPNKQPAFPSATFPPQKTRTINQIATLMRSPIKSRNFDQTIQPYKPINLPQTSVSPWLDNKTQPVRPLVTQNLLDPMEQRQQRERNYKVASTIIPSQYRNYTELINEESPNKKQRTNSNSSESIQSSKNSC